MQSGRETYPPIHTHIESLSKRLEIRRDSLPNAGSAKWNEIEPRLRRQLSIKSNDGEFWMSWEDFKNNWESIQVD